MSDDILCAWCCAGLWRCRDNFRALEAFMPAGKTDTYTHTYTNHNKILNFSPGEIHPLSATISHKPLLEIWSFYWVSQNASQGTLLPWDTLRKRKKFCGQITWEIYCTICWQCPGHSKGSDKYCRNRISFTLFNPGWQTYLTYLSSKVQIQSSKMGLSRSLEP